jgi:hypothetical protein
LSASLWASALYSSVCCSSTGGCSECVSGSEEASVDGGGVFLKANECPCENSESFSSKSLHAGIVVTPDVVAVERRSTVIE